MIRQARAHAVRVVQRKREPGVLRAQHPGAKVAHLARRRERQRMAVTRAVGAIECFLYMLSPQQPPQSTPTTPQVP